MMDETRKIEIADRLARARREVDAAKEAFDAADLAASKAPKSAQALADRTG